MLTRTLKALVVVALVPIATVECAEDAEDRSRFELEPVPATPSSFDVEVGTGIERFEEVPDGGGAQLTYGPQGGFHIWTAARTHDTNIVEGQINVSARYVETDAAVGPPSRWPAAFVLVGNTRERAGLRNFVDDAALANGKRIMLRAEVITKDGRHGAGECEVTATLK